MPTWTTIATLFLAGIAGCAAPERPELDYLPPSSQPAAQRSAFVRQQPWLVWGNILDHLQQQGARVVDLDEAAGKLVVIYSGDPEPYVDCGWIVSRDDDELERVPAARSESSFLRRREGEVVPVERDLRLDARMDVQVEPSGEDAIVRTDSTYVLMKTIQAPDAEQPLHAETISFATGQSDAFSSGTTCQPTGELERLVFEACPRCRSRAADASSPMISTWSISIAAGQGRGRPTGADARALIHSIGFEAKSAVPLNLMVSLITLACALAARSGAIAPLDVQPHPFEVLGLACGGMASAICGAHLVRGLSSERLVQVIGGLLAALPLGGIGGSPRCRPVRSRTGAGPRPGRPAWPGRAER